MGACHSKQVDEDTQDIDDKTRMLGPAGTQPVEYQVDPIAAPNAGYEGNLRNLSNQMVIGGPDRSGNHMLVSSGDSHFQKPLIQGSMGSLVSHNQQGNSMANFGGSTQYIDYRQGNSAVNLQPIMPLERQPTTTLERSINQQGNNVSNLSGPIIQNPVNPQGANMASLGGSIRYNDYGQGSMASLGGSALRQPGNVQGNSMASLGGQILEKPVNPNVSMGSMGGQNRYVPGNSMASIVTGSRGTLVDHRADERGASVNTSSADLQSTGHQQVGSGVMTEIAVRDDQLKKEYDAAVGGMVYVLDQNQTVDGLEPYTPLQASARDLHNQSMNQSMSVIGQTGVVNEALYGNQQGEGRAYETQVGANYVSNPKIQSESNTATDQSGAYNISNRQIQPEANIAPDQSGAYPKVPDNSMQVEHMSHQNMSYQNIGNNYVGPESMTNIENKYVGPESMTRVVDQSANMQPAGNNVYDPSMGQKVYVPNDKVQVDGLETSEVNTRKPPEVPQQALDRKEGS